MSGRRIFTRPARIAAIAPYVWMALFFLVPFGFVLKIALSQTAINLQQNVSLPNNVQPTIQASSLVGEILRYQVTGPSTYSLTDLRGLQDWVIQRRLLSVPGVAQVVTWGGTTKEYHVEVDPRRLEGFGLTLQQVLAAIGNANSKGEYYLVDAVEIVGNMGLEAVVIETSEDEVRGINNKAQLAEAEAVMQARLRQAALDAGVTLVAPETIYLAADTTFGSDVTIEPFVVIGPGVTIGDGAVIHSFSHIVQTSIGRGASIGPYARLRPGTALGDGVRIGNFVETKAATIEAGAKVNHLSYVGDAHVGANANLGAGTITCNYDGFFKHKTTIGEGAFVGTNSSLVAPVKIGKGAYVGSGSVITKDVPDDAMAVERSPQSNREGGAAKYREMKMRAKEGKG